MNKQQLIEKIANEHTIDKGYAAIIINAVDVEGWLRDPDQVPGRTITERVKITDTEAYQLYESAKSFSLDDFKLALESIDGIETVDDPEPTNAERLERLLLDLEIVANPDERRHVAEVLASEGVKAPEVGGDDEH